MFGVGGDVADFTDADVECFAGDAGDAAALEEDELFFAGFGAVDAAVLAGGKIDAAGLHAVGGRGAGDEALVLRFVVEVDDAGFNVVHEGLFANRGLRFGWIA